MDQQLNERAKKYQKKNRRKSIWRKVLGFLGCVVVFCTTYALILPAITQEKPVYCGYEEHVHGESCYSVQDLSDVSSGLFTYECSYESLGVHVHSEECYDEKGRVVCSQADYLVHSHDSSCYNENGELICLLAEKSQHVHNENCYDVHIHTDECYIKERTELICGKEEVAAHTHCEECYERALICTQEGEHTHTDECYENKLICLLSETEGHTHSDECYLTTEKLVCSKEKDLVCTEPEALQHVHSDLCQKNTAQVCICGLDSESSLHGKDCALKPQLSCTLKEHTHNLSCYSNPEADVESKDIWESTLSGVKLSGKSRDDVIALAVSQLGYSESSENYQVASDGKSIKGYSRYGDWYGNKYGDWCAMFVSFCLNYAQVDAKEFPYEASCSRWITELRARELFKEPSGYTPSKGDIIFFDWDGDNSSDHVGFVESCEGGTVTTIEGNASNTVKRCSYNINDPTVSGYGVLPSSLDLTEQELSAIIYTNEEFITPAEDNTEIKLSGMLPEGAYAKAYRVYLNEDLIEGKNLIIAYDITLFDSSGNIFEPESLLDVVIEAPDEVTNGILDNGGECAVYYVPDEGEPEKIDTEIAENEVKFKTDHFSTYVITLGGTLDSVYLNGAEGSDENSGSTLNAPVKTIKKALQLISSSGTVYVSGTVDIDSDYCLKAEENINFVRSSAFTGVLFKVKENAVFTIENVSINGGSADPDMSDIEHISDYAEGCANAPLIVVESGGYLKILEGTALKNNSNKPVMENGAFIEKGYVGLGGAIYSCGDITMLGGTIENCEAQCGGGIYFESGSFEFVNGLIDSNVARDIVPYENRKDNFHKNAGGGVYIGENAEMIIFEGKVLNNLSSREGGGISLGYNSKADNSAVYDYVAALTMNGGAVSNNYAVTTGGGINVSAGTCAYINGGYVEGNRTEGREYQEKGSGIPPGSYFAEVQSGSGIYVAPMQYIDYASGSMDGKSGKAVINNAFISDNEALYGAGIVACELYLYEGKSDSEGAVIFQNTGSGEISEIILTGKSYMITDSVLGGGKCVWSEDFKTNDLTNNSSESLKLISIAKSYAKVFIRDNSSLSGAAVLSFGILEIGSEEKESTSLCITNVFEKLDENGRPDNIEIEITSDDNGFNKKIKLYKLYDSYGNEYWPSYYLGGLDKNTEYTVDFGEISGFETTVEKEGGSLTLNNSAISYKVSVNLKDCADAILPDTLEVKLLRNGESYGENIILSSENQWSFDIFGLPLTDEKGEKYNYSVCFAAVPEGFYTLDSMNVSAESGFTLTLMKIPSVNLTVENIWEGKNKCPEFIEVLLLRNGLPVCEGVKLNEENSWFHVFENLPLLDSYGNEFEYSIEASELAGYQFTVTKAESMALYSLSSDQTSEETSCYLIYSTEKTDSLTLDFPKYSISGANASMVFGAELSLYLLDDEGALIPSTEVNGVLVESWTSQSASSESGGSHLIDLTSGTYYLIETKAPYGHGIMENPIVFTVDAVNKTVSIDRYTGYEDLVTEENENGVFILPIYNNALYVLPETGGSGTELISISGATLVLLAVLLLLYKKHKYRKEEKSF